MRVVHVIKSLGRGGAERLLQETLTAHTPKKFAFFYIYFLPWKWQMVEGLRQRGGTVINLSAGNNISILLRLPRLVGFLRRNQIELMHAHLPWAGILARLAHVFTRIPLVYTEHNKQERYHFLTRFVNRVTFNWQSRVIAVSDDVAESILRNIKPRIPVQVIRNGVDTRTFRRDFEQARAIRATYGITDEEVLIGNVAVFRPQKQLFQWIDLVEKLHLEHGHIRGMLVGAGMLEDEVNAYIKSKHLERVIVLAGLQEQVCPFYSAFDIFLMTSSFEGLPVALLEAMSTECAVVSTAAGGVPEVIDHGVNGLLVAINDWETMSTNLKMLVSDPLARIELGLQAREKVERQFSITSMVRQLEYCYEQVGK